MGKYFFQKYPILSEPESEFLIYNVNIVIKVKQIKLEAKYLNKIFYFQCGRVLIVTA